MFESIHGSTTDIAGKGIANPISTIWAGCMMMSFRGEEQAAKLIFDGICETTTEGKRRTPDLGGQATTSEVAEQICRSIYEQSQS